MVGVLHSSAAETPESVKSDDEATAALEHLLSCAPQPENVGIDGWLPVVEESDKDAKALLATCGFLKSFVECLIDLVCFGVSGCRAQALLKATKDLSCVFLLF